MVALPVKVVGAKPGAAAVPTMGNDPEALLIKGTRTVSSGVGFAGVTDPVNVYVYTQVEPTWATLACR